MKRFSSLCGAAGTLGQDGAYSTLAGSVRLIGHFINRNGVVYAGSHVIIDLWEATGLDDREKLENALIDAVHEAGTVKHTISGLANLFGDGVLNEELMELVDRKSNGRQPGFTKACRMILMESGRAMNSRDICDYFQQKMPGLLARHKDPMASVTTVLNRLVEYGEAEAVVSNGRRAWRWVADVAEPRALTGDAGLVA